MNDFLRSEIDALEDLDGVTPPLFRRVLVAGEREDEASGQDAAALAAVLAEWVEPVAARETADLIALGSTAEAGPGRVSLGPLGGELLAGAPCPVAVAPRGFAATAGEIARIDVGLDGSREAAAALTVAVRIAHSRGARLRLVAVAPLSFELDGAPRPVDPRERERLGRHLTQAGDGLPGIWVESELHEGLPDQILIGLAREADLLVLGSRAAYGAAGLTALGAVAERVVHGAPCPTLVVPAP